VQIFEGSKFYGKYTISLLEHVIPLTKNSVRVF